MNGLRIGIVVATYPEGNSIDVLLPETGQRVSNVQVMTPTGSADTGTVDLPDIGRPDDDTRWTVTPEDSARRMQAVIAFYRGLPICVGFLLPQENQISFQEKNRRVMRHASDVYSTIDKDGNTELFHPSGTYLRIGTAAAHQNLEGTDYDKLWKIEKNTDKQVHIQLTVANGGEVKASINIDPNGHITIEHAGNLSVSTSGNAEIEVEGDTEITTENMTINAETTINGNVTINGDQTNSGTITSDGDQVAGGISTMHHTHPGVQSGGSNTGQPQ